jgi:triacylglycerol lipase
VTSQESGPELRARLHPDVAAFVEGAGMPDLTVEVMEFLRSIESGVALSDEVECEEHSVPGDPEIPVRVYRPRNTTGRLPCLYSIHGGGYVMGDASEGNAVFNEWCPQLQLVGVSVEYRLAPEHSYPVPLEDCYRGLQWTFDHADELGLDAGCIGIRGISGGGGLAAALALLARDRGGPAIAFQLLDCPMLDDRQITRSSRLDGLPLWSKESNEFGWRAYLGDLYGRDDVPATAAPARAEDLSGLPPAFISVGAVDGFVDEDVEYAMRLNHSGVDAELHVYPGACHGYAVISECEITAQSQRDMTDWLRRQLARHRAAPRL